MEEINFKYIESIIFCILSLLLILVGSMSNIICIVDNGGRMPVLSEHHFSDAYYFSYNDKDIISKWYLSDIFKIGRATYSVGDFLMYIGLLFVIIFSIKTIYYKIKNGEYKK